MNLSISQALALGLPVIATLHSGFSDQVTDGKNGYLVPENDPEALAEKLLYLINHEELWTQFSLHSRSIAEQRYDTKVLMNEQIKLYKQIIEQNKSDQN